MDGMNGKQENLMLDVIIAAQEGYPQLAERTGFSDTDAETIKQLLPKLLENDESSARPAGSMEVLKVIWWQHNCKPGQYSSAKVHRSLKVQADGGIQLDKLDGLSPEIRDGF